MFWKRISLVLCLVMGAVGRCWADSNSQFIEVNGFQVHATHILARLHSTGDGTLATIRPQAVALLSSMGLTVRYEYTLVPGLILIDNEDSAVDVNANLAPAAKAQLLQTRIKTLSSSDLFDYVTADPCLYKDALPNDQKFTDGTLWGLQNTGQNGGKPGADIGAVPAWQVTTGTNSVVVAVIDSGIRYTHKDLVENMWHNPGEIPGNGIDDDNNGVIDDVYGFNAITGSGDPFDDDSHGTHVAGTIGAVPNNGYPHVGVCWHVSLMGCKFLDANGHGSSSDAIKCLQYAVRNGAKISNNSYGSPSDPSNDRAFIDAVNKAGKAGHLFIASAGNSGENTDVIPHIPGSLALPTMLSVAALDRKDQLATFSNFGLRTVNVGAPGVEIYSSVATGDTDYDVYQGTSMATPHVVGVAALTLASHPTASAAELRQRVLASVVPVPSLKGFTTTGGRVNAFNAVSAEPTGTLKVAVNPPDGTLLLSGTKTNFFVTVTDIFDITNASVTCTVTDPLGNSGPLAFANDGKAPDVTAGDSIYSGTFNPTNAGKYSFVFVVNAPKKTGVILTNYYNVQARPSNDAFAGAEKIPSLGGVINEDNSLATSEIGEPFHAGISTVGASLWYSWTPPSDQQVLINTFRSSFPTVVAVYTGTSLTSLTPIVSAAATNSGFGVQLAFQAKKSVTYRIAVASVSLDENDLISGSGPFQLSVLPNQTVDLLPPSVSVSGLVNGLLIFTNHLALSGTASDPLPSPSGVDKVFVSLNRGIAVQATGTTNWTLSNGLSLSPGNNTITIVGSDFAGNVSTPLVYTVFYRQPTQGNDAFGLAYVLAGTNGTVTGSNVGATKEVGEPNHGGNQGGHSIWWTYTPPSSGVLSLSTTNSQFDTLLGVYTGTAVGSLTTLGENDDAYFGSGFSTLQIPVNAGVPIYIAVDGFSGAQGSVSLHYNLASGSLVSVSLTAGTGGALSTGSGLYPTNKPLTVQALPNLRYQFAGWTGSQISFDNPLTLNVRPGIQLTANFAPEHYSDDFESGGLKSLTWTTSGSKPWLVTSNQASLGTYSAQAGLIGDSQISSLIITTNSNGGSGSFDYKVSSEAGFDFLSFYIDGALVEQWSGEIEWTTYGFNLSSGIHTFEWRYGKDASGSVGSDTAWIDNVQLNIRPMPSAASVAKDTLFAVTDGSAQILVQGEVNQLYITQWSKSLSGWTPVSTNLNTLGSFLVEHAVGTNSVRYYRTIVAP